MEKSKNARGFKARAVEEFRMYWAIAIYLALMLGAFTWYRRFILSEFHISYLHYGSAIVEAMILAKVILVGRALKIGRQYEDAPLAIAVLIKAVAYSAFIALFFLLEHLVEGLLHGRPWDAIAHGLVQAGKGEILARTLMVVVSLIPFLAFWEVDRVLGDGTLYTLFFHPRARELHR
jgi:hypothetical protein